jgi:hypothetical protein
LRERSWLSPTPIFGVPAALLATWAIRCRLSKTPVTQLAASRLWEFAGLFLIPLAILSWGLVFWASLEGASPGLHWQDMVLLLLLTLQVAMAIWLIWRHRSRIGIAVALSFAAIIWGAGASFVSGMALTNVWL